MEKETLGFRIYKIWQILKRFAGSSINLLFLKSVTYVQIHIFGCISGMPEYITSSRVSLFELGKYFAYVFPFLGGKTQEKCFMHAFVFSSFIVKLMKKFRNQVCCYFP